MQINAKCQELGSLLAEGVKEEERRGEEGMGRNQEERRREERMGISRREEEEERWREKNRQRD